MGQKTTQQQLQNIQGRASRYQNWEKTPGNRVRLEYYTGVEAGNPSGATDNIKYVFYETLQSVTALYAVNLQLELTYDAADNLLTAEGTNN